MQFIDEGRLSRMFRPARFGRSEVHGPIDLGKVSWRVEAVRNDLWVRRGGAPVETRKQGPEKGTYQHPELYGQPAEKGLHHEVGLGEEALRTGSGSPSPAPTR